MTGLNIEEAGTGIETGDELPADDFLRRATADRFNEIRLRLERSIYPPMAIARWTESLLPTQADLPAAHALRGMLETDIKAAWFEANNTIPDSAPGAADPVKVLSGVNALIKALSVMLASLDKLLAATGLPRNFERPVVMLGGERVTIEPVHALHGLIRGLESDAAWLVRQTRESALTAASTSRERVRRMRQRQKAGFSMATVAVHDADISLLQRLGMLRQDYDRGDLDDALTLFLSGALTAAHSEARPRSPGVEPPTESRPGNASRFPELRAAPLLAWTDRIRRLIAAQL